MEMKSGLLYSAPLPSTQAPPFFVGWVFISFICNGAWNNIVYMWRGYK